ncbi:hypothetical protein M5X11_12860 [Paenibacillus alginolyticus]|uniref:hypothetical protein n=1 Tax=Paenibacillus alginolyticus TaxID=59839 RepID=UPI00042142A2|nr:hypothetical protein [Paenibacillus alginolyticus]MCY9665845.1 hypothetical protein [Paenibacillus alginolyticus]
MLFTVEGKPIRYVFHYQQFETWKRRMDPEALDAIYKRLDEEIYNKDIHYSSWVPGADWNNTVFLPIYEIMCGDEVKSRKFFGNIFMDVFIRRAETWIFNKGEQTLYDRVPGSYYWKTGKKD